MSYIWEIDGGRMKKGSLTFVSSSSFLIFFYQRILSLVNLPSNVIFSGVLLQSLSWKVNDGELYLRERREHTPNLFVISSSSNDSISPTSPTMEISYLYLISRLKFAPLQWVYLMVNIMIYKKIFKQARNNQIASLRV